MVSKKQLVVIALFTFVLLGILTFIFAAVAVPTGLTFGRNSSASYDEGNFTVNWTAGAAGDINYTIWIYSNGKLYTAANNDSALGYSFNNWTEATYNFTIQANNVTGPPEGSLNSTTNITMTVDRTGPAINVTGYTNITNKKNTGQITLNISLLDSSSGTTGSVCLIDVNGTGNQTVVASNGWCNSSVINLTGSTDGNKTLNIWANDTVGNWKLNNSYIIQIDTTAPVITLPVYTNVTNKKNTDTLTLNISVTDATAGLTGAVCLVSIGGNLNQTVSVSNGWCNMSNGNLTGLSDGNKTIAVWVNDTINNSAFNSSYTIQIDTTAPTATFSCTPNPVTQKETLTCTCTGSDTTAGINSTTYTSSPSTQNTGTYTETCTVIDNSGNSYSLTTTYDVSGATGSSSSGGGGGGSTTNIWTGGTQSISEDVFVAGFDSELRDQQRIQFVLNGDTHHVGVTEITSSTVTIQVASTPQTATLSVGDIKMFELDGDNYYDLQVTLSSITTNKANISMINIHQLIDVVNNEVEEGNTTSTDEISETTTNSSKSWSWRWIVIGSLVLIGIIVGIILGIKKNKK